MIEHSERIRVLCLNPLVLVVDDVFDAALADKIISLGSEGMARAKVVGKTIGDTNDSRTNDAATIDQWSVPELTGLVTEISGIVRLPPENSEPTQLLRYRGKQRFEPHPDAFSNTPSGREALAQGGQRLFTTICYLNDVDTGGETEFPHLKLRIAPRLGRVLIFANTRLGTAEPHPHSEHSGRAVGKGEKFALSIWWRQLAYHVQRQFPPEDGETRLIG